MKVFCFTKKYYVFFVLLSLFLSFSVNAQVNPPILTSLTNPDFDFLISWKATNYVPADYKGKILPSKNSPVQISFDVLDNGKFVNIANQQIEWYLNDSLIKSGAGLKSILFTPISNSNVIEILIPNYNDTKYKAAELSAVITIPLASPEVVINAPFPNKSISIGDSSFQVLPYFFNINTINQLKIDWDVDGTKNSGQANRQDILNLTTTSQGQAAVGTNIGIKAFVQNILNQFEFAQNYINLNIK